jgi:hypothetical protein
VTRTEAAISGRIAHYRERRIAKWKSLGFCDCCLEILEALRQIEISEHREYRAGLARRQLTDSYLTTHARKED